MTPRFFLLVPALALLLSACVDRGDWKPAPQLQAQDLSTAQTLHDVKLDTAAWPTDQWWRSYGDPQLDALVGEALAGSPSLEIAQARLRAAQAQRVSAKGARAPQLAVNGEVSRQRYPEHGLYPAPLAGSYSTDARAGA